MVDFISSFSSSSAVGAQLLEPDYTTAGCSQAVKLVKDAVWLD